MNGFIAMLRMQSRLSLCSKMSLDAADRQLARLNSILFQGTAKTVEGGGAAGAEEPVIPVIALCSLRRCRAMGGGLLPLLVGALPSARAPFL